MADTKPRDRSRLLVFGVIASFLISMLPLPRNLGVTAARTALSMSHSKAIPAAPDPSAAGVIAPQTVTYDVCLQDNSNGSNLSLNTTTGDYIFTCGTCVKKTGVGTVTVKGCTVTLQHNPSDRRVIATIDKCARRGTASLQTPPGSTQCTISDSNLAVESCSTDLTPPQVGLTAPNGGEIIDTRSSFTISWESMDDVGVVSHDVSLSTDGGSTFSTIAAGLPGSVNQYAWAVPLMVNNKTVRVRVLARDAACNVAQDISDTDLTVWNPPASFTHSAEAPLFLTGPGTTSTVFMTNTSSSPVVVELDPHKADGNATQNFPYQTLLNAGASATVSVASLYTIGASPENPAVPDTIDGGIRLRHNGSQDKDVRALIVVERDCSEEFTTPFTYATSSLSATGTMQCSAMYYVDNDTDALVSFQNVTNVSQTVQLTCNYGTGAPGTPNGKVKNQPIVLGPQQTRVVNLRSIWGQFGYAEWGSMDVSTSNPQSVICHSVMRSIEKGIAWDCPFVDPAMSVSTTKVAQSIVLDYNNSENAYVMIRNFSPTNSRTVTASFNTTTKGLTIPPVQLTIAPGAQQMITLNARQLLTPGSSTTADVRLTYAGSPSDIGAAGCSLTANEDRVVAVKFNEPSANDGRRLTSPYFRFDEYVSGRVLVSNLGSSSIKVGARMVFANSTIKPLKTPAVTIQAGGMAIVDLSSVGDSVPANVIATGRVDLIHSGPAGTVSAAVTESGCYNTSQVVPLEGGVPLDPVTLFPVGAVVIPGGCTEAEAITDGTITNPEFANPSGCFGTLIQTFASGPNTFQTTMCIPTNCFGEVPLTYVPPGGGAGDESSFEVVQTSAAGFSTSLGTRLNPNGTTQFTLTATDPFPNALLQVEFAGGGGSVSTQVQGSGMTSISGTGPVNHVFLGKVKKIFVTQLNPDGTPNTSVPRVLKAKNTGAYFALDPPASITSVAPNAVPVSGGTVTITGTGFQTWQLGTAPNTVNVNPVVLIGKTNANRHDQIPFTVISVAADQRTISGNVGPTPNTVATCAEAGVTPCKAITVINPGGSDGVDSFTSENLLTINAPPPPVITGTAALNVAGNAGPAASNSIGAQHIRLVNGFTTASPVTARIIGRNLNRVISLNFGSQQVPIGPSNINSAGTRIEAEVPSFCLAGANATVAVSVDDGVNPLASFANGWIYTATGPLQIFVRGFQGAIVFVAGPCEHLNMGVTTWNVPSIGDGFLDGSTNCSFSNPLNASCARIINVHFEERVGLTTIFPNANFGLITWTTTCQHCTAGSGTVTGSFQADATNTNSNTTVRSCQTSSCTRN